MPNLAAACYHCTFLRSQKNHELAKLQHSTGFTIRSSDDLHMKLLLLEIEMMGKYRGLVWTTCEPAVGRLKQSNENL